MTNVQPRSRFGTLAKLAKRSTLLSKLEYASSIMQLAVPVMDVTTRPVTACDTHLDEQQVRVQTLSE